MLITSSIFSGFDEFFTEEVRESNTDGLAVFDRLLGCTFRNSSPLDLGISCCGTSDASGETYFLGEPTGDALSALSARRGSLPVRNGMRCNAGAG